MGQRRCEKWRVKERRIRVTPGSDFSNISEIFMIVSVEPGLCHSISNFPVDVSNRILLQSPGILNSGNEDR